MQSKINSLKEAISNTAVGFIVSYISSFLIFPDNSAGTNFLIVLYFTVISILRGYIIRRYFNNKSTKKGRTIKYPNGEHLTLYCFACKTETSVIILQGSRFCDNCGLKH